MYFLHTWQRLYNGRASHAFIDVMNVLKDAFLDLSGSFPRKNEYAAQASG
jgi:hypothetical protein